MNNVRKFNEFNNKLNERKIKREIPELRSIDEEYKFDSNYKLNKFIGMYLSIGEIIQVIPVENDLHIIVKKDLTGDRFYITYSSRQDKLLMSQIKLTNSDNQLLSSIVSEFKNTELSEGVAYPTVKPTVKPGIKQNPGKASPLRRDRPSVVPGPKAITELDIANKFLNLTKNNNNIIQLLKRKYNK